MLASEAKSDGKGWPWMKECLKKNQSCLLVEGKVICRNFRRQRWTKDDFGIFYGLKQMLRE